MAERQSVIIIGSGPAGYTAALYLSRARLAPLLFTGKESGGQLMYTTTVENYPGFAQGVNGADLMLAMRSQAEHFGTQIKDSSVTRLEKIDQGFRVWQDETAYEATAVLVATGARARTLSLPDEDKWLGRGVSICAVCDAAFFRDKNVYVVGGGDSAMEDALALTKHAQKVHLVHRRDAFRASQIMQERVLYHPKVEVLWNTTVTAIQNDGQRLTGLTLQNTTDQTEQQVAADGLFFAIGHVPATDWLPPEIQLNDQKYVVTRLALDRLSLEKANQHLNQEGRLDFPTMTTQEGIFAAGDCVDFRYRQAITAAAFGTMAALDIERWLEAR